MSRSMSDRFASVGEFAEALRRGATWSERDAARDFAAQIAQDFTGDLPDLLNLESLAVRDAAWRDAQGSSGASGVALSTSPPDLRSAVTKRDGVAGPVAAAEMSQGAAHEAASRTLWIALAAGVALVGLLAVVLLRPSNAPVPAPIIVEKQSLVEAAPPSGVSPTAAPVATVPATPSSASAASTNAPAKSEPGSSRKTLASAFQRRQGAIQHCFAQNPATGETQRISVRFEIDRSGHVVSSALSPPGLESQPLGSCILGVARNTDFGPQVEAVSFSIPISARVVAR
jgi:hypothetical protein